MSQRNNHGNGRNQQASEEYRSPLAFKAWCEEELAKRLSVYAAIDDMSVAESVAWSVSGLLLLAKFNSDVYEVWDREKLAEQVTKAHVLGLSLAPGLDLAFIRPQRNSPDLSLMVGYRGKVLQLYRTRLVSTISADWVGEEECKRGCFRHQMGTHPKIMHVKDGGVRGPLKFAWCSIRMKDGGILAHVSDRAAIEDRKGESAGAKRKDSAWDKWYEEMALKTPLSQAIRFAPMSLRSAVALDGTEEVEELLDTVTHVNVVEPRPQPQQAPPQTQQQQPRQPQQQQHQQQHRPEPNQRQQQPGPQPNQRPHPTQQTAPNPRRDAPPARQEPRAGSSAPANPPVERSEAFLQAVSYVHRTQPIPQLVMQKLSDDEIREISSLQSRSGPIKPLFTEELDGESVGR